jgi:acyl-CoA synthetase (AMP-forming)/AMP-acid ligase II/acyl carrier protein
MKTLNTLLELLEDNAGVDQYIGYLAGEYLEHKVTYGDLHRRALEILGHLQRCGARAGDKLIIFLNGNESFIEGFWGAIAGGIVPVPLAVGISDEHRHKLLRIAKKLGDPFLYTDGKSLERLGAVAVQVGEPAVFDALRSRTLLVDGLTDVGPAGDPVRSNADDIALIQFSSGSTSEPKGVVLTHRNILTNVRAATEAVGFTRRDVSVSWVPLTHDLGLIGFFITMFANGMQLNLMPTELFVRRPLLWTQFAARKRATLLCSPNFGLRHYLKALGERTLADIDLSSVRMLLNGGEPISVGLCNEFLDRLAHTGLRRTAMFPVYGLAEATLSVCCPKPDTPFRSIVVDRHHLKVGEEVQVLERHDADGVEFMGVGKPIPYVAVRITDDEDQPFAEGRVGHLQIRGDSVTRGYFEAPEANARGFAAGGWLRTGDLGLWQGGELFVTGRSKDIIFVNGQNYFPHDLEAIAERAAGLDLGKVVAAGCRPSGAETDQLTIFVLYRGNPSDFLALAAEVTRLVNEHAGLEVTHVVPVKRIPKTTSGKVQRHLLERAFVEGEFAEEMAELARLREAAHHHAHDATGAVERRLKAIVDEALPGKRVEVDDNLFEIGASSLSLVQIHEQLDGEWPGLIDVTELADYPTVEKLARYIEDKLRQG